MNIGPGIIIIFIKNQVIYLFLIHKINCLQNLTYTFKDEH